MQLLPFQSEKSKEIVSRYKQYLEDPESPSETRLRLVPFFQTLSAITGAGKTIILADAIERMREVLPNEPIVLWVSKGKVVVEQTFTNLDTGKYRDLIPGFQVKALADFRQEDCESDRGVLLMATVATFNQRDQDRRVFKMGLDHANQTVWNTLKNRVDGSKAQRPLIIVYDEGHNLSDQQTDLLLDLNPSAIISASATPRHSARLTRVIDRLTQAGWESDKLSVSVPSSAVVDSGLIKSHLVLGGYDTSLESTIDDLLSDLKRAASAAVQQHLSFRPKAIYVCATNVIEGGINKGQKDDPKQPFNKRAAPPILIWRYLTEKKKIDPKNIAVYCDLAMHKSYPLPEDLVLFRGGDNDYAEFMAGKFEHIIFNLSLQEGWDDPECYFAYIDKSMGSQVQIEQLIGRVLRQPDGQHYSNARLNSAHFYVRLDKRTAFPEVLAQVRRGLKETASEVELTHYTSHKEKERTLLEPKQPKEVPDVSVDATEARAEVRKVVDLLNDYRGDNVNTKGTGGRVRVLKKIGEDSEDKWEWDDTVGANRLTARSLFVRRVHALYPRVVNVCDIEQPKFDALVDAGSVAAQNIEQAADSAVDAFIRHSNLVQKGNATKPVGPIYVDSAKRMRFKNAIHDGYSGLNPDEERLAKALDKTRLRWCRNPSRSGISIPLLRIGNSKNFYPDFFIWRGKTVFALDTKGAHILSEEASYKLFDISRIGSGPKLVVRFVSVGSWSDIHTKKSDEGFTVWRLRDGRPAPIRANTIADAVAKALKA